MIVITNAIKTSDFWRGSMTGVEGEKEDEGGSEAGSGSD